MSSTYKEFQQELRDYYDLIKAEVKRRGIDNAVIAVGGVFVEPTTVSEGKICQ